jgi:glycosyltransferase involved in cell wall biosynthesis
MEKNEPDAVLPLVVMGGEGWKNSNLKGLFEKLKQKYPEKFIITGYASEEDQWFYLAGARYLLLLSHYEGYGMPIAEARVCGTEVVCTDIPEMREAALGQGIFLSKEEVTEKLPPFFLRSHRLSKRNAIANYPNNREKAERMIDIINRIKDQKEAVVR